MIFPKANSFAQSIVASKIMGPNPLKMCEELLTDCIISPGQRVCDLGSGMGITSVLMAREYGFDTYAVDLWSDPAENAAFFAEMGAPEQLIHPVKADATEGLPFDLEFFDHVVSIDSYNYYGRDPEYLGAKLLPYVKPGGYLYLAIPGMVRDCHDALPPALLASWTPDQLEYMHDAQWWRAMIEPTKGVEIVDIRPMQCTEEAWADWIACDNEYAVGDRAAVEAGALQYLNSLAVVLRKK